MAKVVSQETFDDIVKENIVDFSMSVAEAKEETIKQFEAQGISLVNIIKDLNINESTGNPVINDTIDDIKKHISEKTLDKEQLLRCLQTLESECEKSLALRVLAGKNGAHDALITVFELDLNKKQEPNIDVLEQCLRAVNSLIHKQPDLFGAEALAIVHKLLALRHENTACLTLQWLQKVSVMHEMNRQNIMSSGIMRHMKPLVSKEQPQVLREVLALFRFLVLDDDIRVEFGCAHEHARQIANEYMAPLTKLLEEFNDINLLADLMLTIGTLAVRQEFCKIFEEGGRLKLVLDIMSANTESVRLNREALKLLRALAGNDSVKVHIVQQGAAPIIKELLHAHMSNETMANAALACISTLTLRVKENSAAFFETGVAEIIVEVLRLHPKNKTIQRNGAWAIRNMVSRSREQCDVWLSFGVEDLLNTAMTEHDSVRQDIKAALRDLGCKVELKEEWTGKAEKKIAA